MEAIQSLLNLTIFKLTKSYWWSPWLVGIYFLYLFGWASYTDSLTLAETMFVLYGIGIMYIVSLYGGKIGLLWSAAAFLMFTYPILDHRIDEFTYGGLEDFILEGIVMPVGFFLLSIYIGRIIANTRNVNDETQRLYKQILDLHHQSEQTLAGFILAMSRAIELKDVHTKGHSERVACYSMLLAEKIGLTRTQQKNLFYGAVLHDIGKIGIADSVLTKPGRLDPDEWVEMQLHPAIGKVVLEAVPGLEYVMDPISLHHENLDGTGYPYGVKEDGIPLSARIVAIADSFDAMTSDRPYRPGMPAAKAVEELFRFCDIRFDRRLVNLFVEAMQERNFQLMNSEDFTKYFLEFSR
ncbi:HD-GYP domain-containing protein [Effusibacillus lacus]|uniref:HD-GYP domain-containing protein n=1 Tax=Effusibacillus lacus TaxID=1348429 RepID=A0A292YPG1_9BACL|nr:HD-GYP domain-containing protein [Effusibacillus lacus]TCS74204.1 HD domain-containing protein [Effusibacillus lacus]GAX90799.1 hypothetical protein EFBL_2441 [Effusibacillus lacus]